MIYRRTKRIRQRLTNSDFWLPRRKRHGLYKQTIRRWRVIKRCRRFREWDREVSEALGEMDRREFEIYMRGWADGVSGKQLPRAKGNPKSYLQGHADGENAWLVALNAARKRYSIPSDTTTDHGEEQDAL